MRELEAGWRGEGWGRGGREGGREGGRGGWVGGGRGGREGGREGRKEGRGNTVEGRGSHGLEGEGRKGGCRERERDEV